MTKDKEILLQLALLLPFENLNTDDIGYQKPKPRTFLSFKSLRIFKDEKIIQFVFSSIINIQS